MKIKVSEIPDDGLEINCEEAFKSELLPLASKARYRLMIDKAGKEVLIRGVLSGDVVFSCGRCLKEFERELSVDVDLAYLEKEFVKGEDDEPEAVSEDDLETCLYENNEIDLKELFQEQLILNMPIKPLCSEECKGLCPHCGTNLNETACNCEVVRTDPRLSVLKDFFERRDK